MSKTNSNQRRQVHVSLSLATLALTFAWLLAVATYSNGEAHVKNAYVAQLPAEWTVMVFMDGDNDLEKFAIKDFVEIASVPNSAQVNVVVQLDRVPGWSNAHGDWSHTLRFRISQGMAPTVANALPPQESELTAGQETNMGHPDTLASFVSWAKRKYPARRHMLILWDHGDGWRRLHTVSPQVNSAAAKEIRRADAVAAEAVRSARGGTARSLGSLVSIDRTLDAPHRAISMDQTDMDRLYMREVQTSLEAALGGQRLDMIGFDACLMAMVENGFAMRRVADVLVGSEELEPGDGWRYDDWLPALVSNPTLDAAGLGRLLVDSYSRTYVTTDPETTLSAVNLSQGRISALAQAVSAFGDELTASLDTELPNIRGARESCTPYAPGRGFHGIDLHRFCEQLIARTTRPVLRERAQAVLQILNDQAFVISSYAGADRRGTFGSRGLAIYFPKTKASYASDSFGGAYRDENETYPVDFVRQHRWDNFLHVYFEHVP
jgi:hypothetical protein